MYIVWSLRATGERKSSIFVSWATVCKKVRPMLSDRCQSCPVCPVCDVDILWPNDWMDQDETWHAGRPRPWPPCIRWRPSSLSPNGAQPPIFGPYLLARKRRRCMYCRKPNLTLIGEGRGIQEPRSFKILSNFRFFPLHGRHRLR